MAKQEFHNREFEETTQLKLWLFKAYLKGPKARPMKKEWVDPILKECRELNVPFFFKQWGKPKFNSNTEDPTISKEHPHHAKGGCHLDGQIYREMPVLA